MEVTPSKRYPSNLQYRRYRQCKLSANPPCQLPCNPASSPLPSPRQASPPTSCFRPALCMQQGAPASAAPWLLQRCNPTDRGLPPHLYSSIHQRALDSRKRIVSQLPAGREQGAGGSWVRSRQGGRWREAAASTRQTGPAREMAAGEAAGGRPASGKQAGRHESSARTRQRQAAGREDRRRRPARQALHRQPGAGRAGGSRLTIVEAAGIPHPVVAAAAAVEIHGIGTAVQYGQGAVRAGELGAQAGECSVQAAAVRGTGCPQA